MAEGGLGGQGRGGDKDPHSFDGVEQDGSTPPSPDPSRDVRDDVFREMGPENILDVAVHGFCGEESGQSDEVALPEGLGPFGFGDGFEAIHKTVVGPRDAAREHQLGVGLNPGFD